jgi:hypothetical protein
VSQKQQCLLLATVGVIVLFGCAGLGSAGAVKYNNDIAAVTKELENVDKDFAEQIKVNMFNFAKIKEAHASATRRADEIIQRGRAIPAYNSPEGQSLHQEFLKFLDLCDEMFHVEYSNMVRDIGQGNEAGIQAMGDRVQRKNDERMKSFRAAQQNFAKANNFRLQ